MKYQGGKHRIAKDILPIILKDRKPGQWFVEPFCGGCNITVKVDGPRIAGDAKPELIAFWQAVQNGWVPKIIKTKKQYDLLKRGRGSAHERGWAAVGASHSGKWFGGFVGIKRTRLRYGERAVRHDQKESLRAVEKTRAKLKGVTFYPLSYELLPLPSNSIIYCDPPYSNTTGYGVKFDSEKFFEWCREKAKEGHTVFVSEFTAPEDFKCVWKKDVSTGLGNAAKPAREKLFKL